MAPRRSYGTGSLFVKQDSGGGEVWYGQWRVGGRLVKRKLGQKRPVGSSEGLTKRQAEAELRRAMQGASSAAPRVTVTVQEAGEAYLGHLASLGRKRSTLMDYESGLRVHLAPFFGRRPIDRIRPGDIEALIALKTEEGRAPKSIRNYLGLLHSVFAYAERRGWCQGNPCKLVEKPRDDRIGDDIRFLTSVELEALLEAVPDDVLGQVERPLYLCAAMTGLRQGELLGLRWRDVDWLAGRIRVRQSYVRGEFGTPKSKRSTRSVPLADRVAAELEEHSKRALYRTDGDLVFGHPHLGKPLDRSKVLKRFKRAAARAHLGHVRFHEYADVFVMPTRLRSSCSGRSRGWECRHNQRASRKARSASAGW